MRAMGVAAACALLLAPRPVPADEPYRTPLAGEAFRTTVLGREVDVAPRDRRRVDAWDLGLELNQPPPQDERVLPFGSLYFWRHPDAEQLDYAIVSGVYDDVRLERALGGSPAQGVLTFFNYTLPVDQTELVDGRSQQDQSLLWGVVRGGVGLGYRTQIAPGEQDNLFAASLTVEPGYLYFHRGGDAAADFEAPQDTFELRGHLSLRGDALQRNLLELPHRGFAFGGDATIGRRFNWDDWGIEDQQSASATRDPWLVTGYALAAGGVPFVPSERHRLIGSLHAGVGGHLDRFSSPRIGGGPDGTDYTSVERVIVPGAAIEEFLPHHYVVAVAEYRFEPIFFVYLGLRASAGWLDLETRDGSGGTRRQDGFVTSIGGRLTTGFFFQTRLQLDYAYSPDIVRRGGRGGNEVVLHVSREF